MSNRRPLGTGPALADPTRAPAPRAQPSMAYGAPQPSASRAVVTGAAPLPLRHQLIETGTGTFRLAQTQEKRRRKG